MNMNRKAVVALFFTALLCSCSLVAGDVSDVDASDEAVEAEVEPDVRIGKQLKELDYSPEIDEDGDYKLVLELEDERTQLVYVRSPVHEYGSHAIREIWAPAYRIDGGRFPAPVSERLLEDSHSSVLGSWVKQGEYAIFVIKVATDVSTEQLEDALVAAAYSADNMEQELTPDSDEF